MACLPEMPTIRCSVAVLVQAFLVSTRAQSWLWHSLCDVIRSRRVWWRGDLDSVIMFAVRS
jgi:hypothetical protein